VLICALASIGLFIALASTEPVAVASPGLKELRVGVEPDQNSDALRRRYAPLIDYLAAQTGLPTRLVIPANYDEAVRLIGEGEVDIANIGGLSFVTAESRYNSDALVMREIDTRFTTWFVTRPGAGQASLTDFRGKSLSFGSRLSTSGHLMPRYFLRQIWKIEPEDYFTEIRYSPAHDQTVQQVVNGAVDLGAVNSAIVRKMIHDGRLAPGDIRVLWQTPPYPDYVWTVREGLGEAERTRLRDAFMRLDYLDPADNAILASLDARAFLPADPGAFDILGEIAAGLDLGTRAR
jgi:phosphonate transport system substrate-binding protein